MDNTNIQTLKRKLSSYDEECRLLRNVKENVPGVLQIAFTWYPLDDYYSIMWEWLQAAIGNEKNTYQNGQRRISLLKFHDEISLLLKVLNAINETNKIVAQTGNKQNKSLAETNLTVSPTEVIQEFCQTFTWQYCRMELWDWLDSGISNEDFYKVGQDRSFLLLEYQCIYSLIEAAYIMYSQFEIHELEFDEKETKESKALLNISYFFLNNPLEQSKAMMQEFYSSWVHHTAEVAAPKEHSEKLMFHDYVVQFFDELHKAVEEPIGNEKVDKE